MTDLRDRIAAVLLPDLEYAYAYNPGPQSPEDWAKDLADAVIAELERGHVLVPKNVTLVQWADPAFAEHAGGDFIRDQITDWKADDE